MSSNNDTSVKQTTPDNSVEISPDINFYIYLGIFLGFLLFSFLRCAIFSIIAISVGKSLHRKLFRTIMRVPMSFFEKNTVGKCELS